MRSISIRPELTNGRPTGKDYAKSVFEHITVVCRDNVPCSAVSIEAKVVVQMYSQVVSSLRAFLVIKAARAMLNAAVIRPRPKRMFSCLLVFALICTPHNRNWGIKAVATSHTHTRAM